MRADVDRDHDPDDGEHPPRRLDLVLDRAGEPRDREPADDEADEREERTPRRARRGARPCRGRTGWPRSAGLHGDADREERQQPPRRGRCRSGAPPRRARGCPLARPAPSFSARSAARPPRPRRARFAAAGSCADAAGASAARAQRLPRRACSRSIASKSALKLPSPNAVRAVALDHLEEERRPVLRRLREDLQQVAVVVAVGEDPEPPQVVVVLVDLADAARRRPRSTSRACRGTRSRAPAAPRRCRRCRATASRCAARPGRR